MSKAHKQRVGADIAFIAKVNEQEVVGTAHDIKELKSIIGTKRGAFYEFHTREGKNDVAEWVDKALGDKRLANKVKKTSDWISMVRTL